MLVDEVLIIELSSILTSSTSTVLVGEITALCHEPGNDAVKWALVVALARGLLLAEMQEVLGGLRDGVIEELHYETAGLAAADADIEVHSRVDHGTRSRMSDDAGKGNAAD